jgi:hypothetical protein
VCSTSIAACRPITAAQRRDREWSSETLRNFLGMVYHVYGKHIDNTLTPSLRKIIDANGKDPAAAFCAWCEPSKGEPA